VDCGASEGYSVAFDPLDGSSIIDANFAVGTICGVWPGHGLLNRCGREQAASLVAQYGPRLTVMLALNSSSTTNGAHVCVELTMVPTHWLLTHHRVQITPKAKTFAPGNLRATSDNDQYQALVNYWITHQYTLRYSGGLVPDIYHILTKGQGVFSNASSRSAKAKLRLLYECAPVGLIIEAAGGMTTVAPCEAGQEQESVSILDVPISYLDKRVGLCVGSAEEVERFISFIFN
jgi:sedoheptulose-bisphosphatase